jgi:hypothetical protein
VHVLVSLGKKERKVKNKKRGNMKDKKLYEAVVSQNITPLKIKYYVSSFNRMYAGTWVSGIYYIYSPLLILSYL